MNVLADDLQFRRASGAAVDKETYRLGVVDPTNSYDYVHSEDVEVFTSGNDVMAALRVWAKGIRGKGTAKEMPFQGIFRNVRLFRHDPVSHYGWRCYIWYNERLDA
jgi:hypothetical protein